MAFANKVTILVCAALAVMALIEAIDVFLLLFLAILLANFWRGLGALSASRLPLGKTSCTVLVMLAHFALLGAFGYWMGSRISAEWEQIKVAVPQAWERVQTLPGLDALNSGSVAARATSAIQQTALSLLDFLLVVVLSVFLALQPGFYRGGLLNLLGERHRQSAENLLDELHRTTFAWMAGRVLLMICTGTLTAIGLSILGIPYATFLGVLLGLLSFIPNIGPALAAVPAGLLAMLQGTDKLVGVAVLYLVLQLLDGYVLTPLVNQRSVQVPPALGLAGQMILGVLLGTLGLVVASPLVAVALVLASFYRNNADSKTVESSRSYKTEAVLL